MATGSKSEGMHSTQGYITVLSVWSMNKNPSSVICTGAFWCHLCQAGFQFKSKYDRHLITEKHWYQLSITSLMDVEYISNSDSEDFQFPTLNQVNSITELANVYNQYLLHLQVFSGSPVIDDGPEQLESDSDTDDFDQQDDATSNFEGKLIYY